MIGVPLSRGEAHKFEQWLNAHNEGQTHKEQRGQMGKTMHN